MSEIRPHSQNNKKSNKNKSSSGLNVASLKITKISDELVNDVGNSGNSNNDEKIVIPNMYPDQANPNSSESTVNSITATAEASNFASSTPFALSQLQKSGNMFQQVCKYPLYSDSSVCLIIVYFSWKL